MRRFFLLLPSLVACNGDDTGGDGDDFTLSVVIPSSYSIHADTDFGMAVVDDADAVIDEAVGVIGTDTEIDFTVPQGDGYAVHFWIDSNFDAGTAGTCDFAAVDSPDHQWSYAVGTVGADRIFTLPAHNTDFQDVCASFE